MSELFDKKINRALEQLDSEKRLGVALLALSNTVIDRPEFGAKIEGSYAGRALDLMINVSLRELCLWCCRVWEKNGHSLPVVASAISEKQIDIAIWRKTTHPDWPEQLLGLNDLNDRVSCFAEKVRETANCNLIKKLRITRDEHFAHLLEGRAACRASVASSEIAKGYYWHEVQDLTWLSLELISEAIFIWSFRRHDVHRSVDLFQAYCESFWHLLPDLKQAEEERCIDRAREKSPYLFQTNKNQ